MQISRDEATQALSDISDARARVEKLHDYSDAAPFLILWGLIWLVANSTTQFTPGTWRYGLAGRHTPWHHVYHCSGHPTSQTTKRARCQSGRSIRADRHAHGGVARRGTFVFCSAGDHRLAFGCPSVQRADFTVLGMRLHGCWCLGWYETVVDWRHYCCRNPVRVFQHRTILLTVDGHRRRR